MRRTRVLIVDDAPFMREFLSDIFNETRAPHAFSVVGQACNGIEAVEHYATCLPDVVLMDICMPLKSGIDATRDIIAAHPEAVIIICSALGDPAFVAQARAAGARDFLVKPFGAADVLRAVEQALSASDLDRRAPEAISQVS